MRFTRICIYPKDVQRITGKSERSGLRLLNQIKQSLGKANHQYVTDKEFSEYTGISYDYIRQFLTD